MYIPNIVPSHMTGYKYHDTILYEHLFSIKFADPGIVRQIIGSHSVL